MIESRPTSAQDPLIGLIGGTFDPPHIGHVRLALEAQGALKLDRVAFLPAPTPPHKMGTTKTAYEHRVNMLKIALSAHPGLVIETIELQLPEPHYTVRTLTALQDQLPQHHFCWIMGHDSLASLPHWHEWQQLLNQTHFAVAQRPGSETMPFELAQALDRRWTQDPLTLRTQTAGRFYRLDSFPLAISSRKIRQLVYEGKPIDYLVPNGVFDYIGQNRLYCK